MRNLLLVLMILAVATCAMADRSLEGSMVTLVEPVGPVNVNEVYTFTFFVENMSEDYEYVADITIGFPYGFTPYGDSIGWDPGPNWFYSTGNWTMETMEGDVFWLDADGGWGELEDYEDCFVYVDVLVEAIPSREVITWGLQGDIYGEEPHYVSGEIEIGVTPVEVETWTAIKALYR